MCKKLSNSYWFDARPPLWVTCCTIRAIFPQPNKNRMRKSRVQKGGLGDEVPMRIKLSVLPLCKAGDWGLQTPEKCLCFGFFAASPQKKQNKKEFRAAPQWEISVSFMRMRGASEAPLPG
jgi:hypothetical protein